MPAARLEQKTQQELTFILPDNSVKRGGFEIFFSDLEKKQSELGIDSFGLTDTALEEVFKKKKNLVNLFCKLNWGLWRFRPIKSPPSPFNVGASSPLR